MKKVIFSLKSVALVAMASMAMVSCSDDDTTPAPNPNPEPENPVLTENFVKYDGKYYKLNANTFLIQSTADKKNAALAEYSYVEGGESYVVSEWVGVSWLSEGDADPEYELQVYFDVEAKEVTNDQGQTGYQLQMPNQTENVFVYRVAVIKNGEIVADTESAYGSIEVNFNVFNLGDTSLDVDYDGKNSVNDITFDYNGSSGLSLMQWYTPQAKKTGSTLRKNSINKAQSLSGFKTVNNFTFVK